MFSDLLTGKKLILLYLGLWLGWIALQTWTLTGIGFSLRIAFSDSLFSSGLLAIAGLGIRNMLRYYNPRKGKILYVFIWNLCAAGLWVYLVRWMLGQFITGHPEYDLFLEKSLAPRFFIGFLMLGWIALISWMLYAFEERAKNEKRKADTETLAKDAELFKLRHQLHPHFLFNSLNSVSSLIGTQPEAARKMLQQLADFLRGTLKNDEKLFVTLEEEFRYLQLYLDIEQVRFGHRLQTRIKHDEVSLQSKVPQMILQPIVENAIKFGLYDTTGAVTIQIHACTRNNLSIIKVENPFDPETAPQRQGTGFGISSIRRRLYLLFAQNDLLETRADGSLFTTTLKIPQTHD